VLNIAVYAFLVIGKRANLEI